MKNIFYLLLLMPLMVLVNSCDDKKEIVFDSELPQFEIKDNAILLEVIMPQGTDADENIYIVGDFNDGENAVGQLEWRLEKAGNSDVKWGIYLFPSTFKNGKTLADGFYFVSEKQGKERTVKNEDVSHVLNVGVGTRTNVTVSRWATYFEEEEEPDKIVHDGYVIYVEDNSGWDVVTLYAWSNDSPELFGAWPGIQPAGTEVKDGVTYKYFDTGADNEGLTYNLIFNNNNGGEQFDAVVVTLNRDYYLRITNTGYEEIDPNQNIKHDGYAIFIEDKSGWDALSLYAWGNELPELFGAWPGILTTGTVIIKGITYKYFDTGKANEGLMYNFICNDGGSNQFDLATVTLDRDYYFSITDKKGVEVDPQNPGTVEPDPDPVDGYTIYVVNNTGWEGLALYAYVGIDPVIGAWPGMQATGSQDINGVTFTGFTMPVELSDTSITIIFNNNNGGVQLPDLPITLNRDYYFTITADACTEIAAPVAN